MLCPASGRRRRAQACPEERSARLIAATDSGAVGASSTHSWTQRGVLLHGGISPRPRTRRVPAGWRRHRGSRPVPTMIDMGGRPARSAHSGDANGVAGSARRPGSAPPWPSTTGPMRTTSSSALVVNESPLPVRSTQGEKHTRASGTRLLRERAASTQVDTASDAPAESPGHGQERRRHRVRHQPLPGARWRRRARPESGARAPVGSRPGARRRRRQRTTGPPVAVAVEAADDEAAAVEVHHDALG